MSDVVTQALSDPITPTIGLAVAATSRRSGSLPTQEVRPMTTSDTTMRTATRPRGANGGDPGGYGEVAQAAMREVRNAIQGVGRSVPDVARVSRSAVDDLVRAIETGSNERVSAGVTLSLGLAIGMLVGGAPRLLIALALAPVAVMSLVLADRRAGQTRAPA